MAKQRTSGNIRGGGFGSRNVKEVPVRTGTPARGINPAAVAQLGGVYGNHITERRETNYRGEPYLVGKNPAGGAVPLGNQLATNVGKGGPGTGREVFKCGSQGAPGPTRSPNASGRDTLAEFGPDTSNARNRR
jgi:hypothetical protein